MGLRRPLAVLLLVAPLLHCAGSKSEQTQKARSDSQGFAPQPIPVDLREAAERAEEIGGLLYLQDKASAIATDVLFARVKSPEKLELGGYITARETDEQGKPKLSWLTVFYGRGDQPRILYRVRIPMERAEEPSLEQLDPPQSPSSGVELLIAARRTALAALTDVPQAINPEILPGSVIGEDGILIYLLAGTKRSDVAVLGRHYRVLVSADGKQVKKLEPLSKSIIEVQKPPATKTAVGLMVTHLLSDAPVETHVLASKQYRMPVYVGTSRGAWRVEDGHISFLGEIKQGER
jgi:hypothetical protein